MSTGRRRAGPGRRRWRWLVPTLAALALTTAACGSAAPTSSPTTSSPTTSSPISPGPATTGQPPAPGGPKPAVPTTGAYLGSWVGAKSKATAGADADQPTTSSLEEALGKALGVANDYIDWTGTVPVATLRQESSQGTIPLVDWECGAPDTDVAAGSQDRVIRAVAEGLRSVGHPVFLRWFWEMAMAGPGGVDARCLGSAGSAGYVAAWRHIWSVFQQVGATNVAFVWCPGIFSATTTAPAFYPGDGYVDWIATDAYALNPAQTFAGLIAPFYDHYAADGKPLMVAETGAHPQSQVAYLQGAAAALPTQFPQIKALLYFDGTGKTADWSLKGPGMAEFRVLAHSPYFNPTT